jgi:hypothetical protein
MLARIGVRDGKGRLLVYGCWRIVFLRHEKPFSRKKKLLNFTGPKTYYRTFCQKPNFY